MVGAGLYTLVAYRSVPDRSTHVPGQMRQQPVRLPKFILPTGRQATHDMFGRLHVVPLWQTNFDNKFFLEALCVRIALVKVRLQILLVELTNKVT